VTTSLALAQLDAALFSRGKGPIRTSTSVAVALEGSANLRERKRAALVERLPLAPDGGRNFVSRAGGERKLASARITFFDRSVCVRQFSRGCGREPRRTRRSSHARHALVRCNERRNRAQAMRVT
jgi:hypothetical protein